MKKVLTGALVALGLSSGAALAAPKDPSGTWLTEDGRARIRIEKCPGRADRVCGYAVWLKTPNDDKGQPRVDFKNTDTKKRSRPSLGHQLIMGLKPNADNRYEGQIYNADDGKLYDVSIWTEEPGELNVRGCLMGFLCGSQTWTRANDVAPGQLTAATGAPNGPRPDPEWAAAPKAAAPAAPAKPAATPAAEPKQ